MTFAHILCCCYFVSKDVNYFIKQKSQLDRFLETLQILNTWKLIEVTVDVSIELNTLQEFGLSDQIFLL